MPAPACPIVALLFAQRADIGGKIGRLAPAQREIRHLRVRVEQEESHFLRREIRLACDCRKRRSIGTGLLLAGVNHVTGGAPALGEICAVIGVGRTATEPLSQAVATAKT